MIQYIAGFFDADGSVGITSQNKKKRETNTKTLCISFSNVKKEILEEIKEFMEEEHGVKMTITPQKKAKEHYQQSYILRTTNKSVLTLARLLEKESRHYNKKTKITLYLDLIVPRIKRNGKYSKSDLIALRHLEQRFIDIGT